MNFDEFNNFNDRHTEDLNRSRWDLWRSENSEDFLDELDKNYEFKEEIVKTYRINEFIELKLTKVTCVCRTENKKEPLEYVSNVYINGEEFIQCMFLLLEIPKDDPKQEEIDSIDEAAQQYSEELELFDIDDLKEKYKIDPETEFWAHCSNIEAWVENDYNTKILHRNIAFPLLKRLTKVGDPKARKKFKDEIAERYEQGTEQVQEFLEEEGYLDFLSEEERDVLKQYELRKDKSRMKKNIYIKDIKESKDFAFSFEEPTQIAEGEDVSNFVPNVYSITDIDEKDLNDLEAELEELEKLLEDDNENAE